MIKSTKSLLILVALVSLGLLGVALYLQFVEKMLPCPLCIMQRYAFAGVALISLVAAFLPGTGKRVGAGLAMLSALAGAGVASWHLWIKAHPSVSCGIDPLENWVNALPTAKLLPQVFYSDGLCTAPLPPLFGLSIPAWSLIWLVILTFTLAIGLIRREKHFR